MSKFQGYAYNLHTLCTSFVFFFSHFTYTTVLWLHSEESNVGLLSIASFSLKIFAGFHINIKHRIFNTLKKKEIEVKQSRETYK